MTHLPRGVLPLQLVLLAIELFWRYDTLPRQLALGLSNVAGIVILSLVARRLRLSGSRLPAAVSWLVVAAIWFDAAGNFVHFYARFSWWDQLAHAVATAAVTSGLWLTLRQSFNRQGVHLPGRHLELYAVSLAILLTVVYEISEYLGDLLFGTNRVTVLYDTADDLLWNTLAALAIVWLFRRWYGARPR